METGSWCIDFFISRIAVVIVMVIEISNKTWFVSIIDYYILRIMAIMMVTVVSKWWGTISLNFERQLLTTSSCACVLCHIAYQHIFLFCLFLQPSRGSTAHLHSNCASTGCTACVSLTFQAIGSFKSCIRYIIKGVFKHPYVFGMQGGGW